MKLLLAFMALIVLANAQTSSLFDDFQAFSSVTANEDEPTMTQVVDGSGILGERRSLTVTRTEGSNNALEASCTIVGGFFALSTDVSVTGNCVASYDGPAGAGFGPVDYNAFGCDCWNLRIIESDNNVGFDITATSASLGRQSSSFMLAVDINDPIDVCIPFGGDRAGYSDVTNVDFAIAGLVANVDVNLQSVCCQPSVSCFHTIDALNGADIDNLVVGDSIKLTVQCTNYESRPADLQEITVEFPFDDNFGIMDGGSIMCEGEPTDSQGVNNNALEFTASLIDTTFTRCMVNVDLVGSGTVDDIAARIFTSSGDSRFPFQSNADEDRQGTLDFCELPEPSSLQIIDPPTTLPPTTLPPTTEPPTTEPPTTLPPTTLPPTTLPPTTLPPTTLPPTTLPPTTEPPTTLPPTTLPPTTLPPTTLPPTTLPPTTEPPTTEPPTTEPPTTEPPTTLPPTTEPPTPPRTVCVAPRIIDGMCDCQTFPCFEADDGSNSFRCETDEWYCWFVITVPPSGRFRVSYRGQMCYCTL